MLLGSVDADDFLSILEVPAREEGRAPVRDAGRGTPLEPVLLIALDPVRLGGRGSGLALPSSNMLSILAAGRSPVVAPGGRFRTVGRISLMEGAWLGLAGWSSSLGRSRVTGRA